MLPCEMARYIAVFWREARKYGRFWGRKAGKRDLKPANPGAGRDSGRARNAFEARAEKVSRSRIKRLHGLRQPQYRLRVGEVRVLYDVTETTVEILAIVAKLEADSWLERFAKPA